MEESRKKSLQAYNKEYYLINRNTIRMRHRIYYLKNKKEISEKKKIYHMKKNNNSSIVGIINEN